MRFVKDVRPRAVQCSYSLSSVGCYFQICPGAACITYKSPVKMQRPSVLTVDRAGSKQASQHRQSGSACCLHTSKPPPREKHGESPPFIPSRTLTDHLLSAVMLESWTNDRTKAIRFHIRMKNHYSFFIIHNPLGPGLAVHKLAVPSAFSFAASAARSMTALTRSTLGASTTSTRFSFSNRPLNSSGSTVPSKSKFGKAVRTASENFAGCAVESTTCAGDGEGDAARILAAAARPTAVCGSTTYGVVDDV